MDGSARIVYLDLQIGEQCMQNANDITIRLLIVDDSGENAEAIVSTLRNSGIAVRPWRPQDAAELSQVLASQAIDLVLASPSQGIPLPLVAQHIAASGKDIPLVLLAERIDEDELVQASSHGIRALALRQRSEHLLAVVRDQWVDLQARRGLRRIEAQMRETERRCDALIASSRDPIAYVHEGMHIRANDAYLEMFGYEHFDDIEGISLLDMVAAQHVEGFKQLLKGLSRGEAPPPQYQLDARHEDGSAFPATMEFTPPPTRANPACRWYSAAAWNSTRNWRARSRTCASATRSPACSTDRPSCCSWKARWPRPGAAKASSACC